ncbi:hypothetical protein CO015_01460 [candidate division WWE3 bacterium CG_4_8_14_3_um_filter_42_11]|uniref:Cytochrome b5 heme-binding domain-containing protein n=1 Tax=candidate division WWE3 bacterium CG_4_8_14_3_um_filter_42_11 TaxID=1975076 RepID=A0A2M8G7L3_UNCKA|nr:MAG: hypothetical protein CO015_01460 [candidate division WWE3 bacterium CG_4_8_14_3_um_filter_42_11]
MGFDIRSAEGGSTLRKKLTLTILFLVGTILFLTFLPTASHLKALTSHTAGEVAQHHSADDCWMIFEGKVYDVTACLFDHDRYLNIENWCGQDMTQDFKDKAGMDEDHLARSYALLDDYYLGDLVSQASPSEMIQPAEKLDSTANLQIKGQTATSSAQQTASAESGEKPSVGSENPYNFTLPFVATLVLYFLSYQFLKLKGTQKYKILARGRINFFWNSLLILSAIPSVLFGFYLVFRYPFPALRKIDFDLLYLAPLLRKTKNKRKK